jgi:hypothetical protein
VQPALRYLRAAWAWLRSTPYVHFADFGIAVNLVTSYDNTRRFAGYFHNSDWTFVPWLMAAGWDIGIIGCGMAINKREADGAEARWFYIVQWVMLGLSSIANMIAGWQALTIAAQTVPIIRTIYGWQWWLLWWNVRVPALFLCSIYSGSAALIVLAFVKLRGIATAKKRGAASAEDVPEEQATETLVGMLFAQTGNAGEVAQKTGIPLRTVYNILGACAERGEYARKVGNRYVPIGAAQ